MFVPSCVHLLWNVLKYVKIKLKTTPTNGLCHVTYVSETTELCRKQQVYLIHTVQVTSEFRFAR